MRTVLQRVRSASVAVDGREVASIAQGLVALVGFGAAETPDALQRMARRLLSLRLFDDDAGRLNRSLPDVGGELLVVPQVTLTTRLDSGARPSFHTAAKPDDARRLFDAFLECLKQAHPAVKAGVFQAHMLLRLENDGPVTFVLDES